VAGGDEVTTLQCWAQDAGVQAWMAANNVSDVRGVREWFQVRVQTIANSLGLRVLMWEVSAHGLSCGCPVIAT